MPKSGPISRIQPPTYIQSTLASIFLVLLSFLFIPITLPVTLLAYLCSALTGSAPNAHRPPTGFPRKTILVTGARTNKALTLARAFKRANYRVILAEEKSWGIVAPARFSRAADVYHELPDPEGHHGQHYIDRIKALIIAEHVDAWVPCSTVHATMIDAEAARQIHEMGLGGDPGGCCDTFIPHPYLCETLHWKDRFGDLLRSLGYPAPESKRVITVAQAVDFLHAPHTLKGGHKYILKCLTLDDLGRDDFTFLPLPTRQETVAHLKRMPTPISAATPFLVQRFLKGKEYCTHVAVRRGEITAFVACRSRELLMRYVDITTLGDEGEIERAREIEAWISGFLQKWKDALKAQRGEERTLREMTGHFSFDFIWDETDGILYPLECNVRAHTAVVLFSEVLTLSDSYLVGSTDSNKNDRPPLSRPPPNTPPRSWIAHAFPVSLISTFLRLPIIQSFPISVWSLIHPGLSLFVDPPSTESNGITNGATHATTNGTSTPRTPLSSLTPSPSYPSSPPDRAHIDPTLSPSASDNPLTVLVKFALGTFLRDFFSVPASWGVEKDPYWEWDDPLPWFVLAHVTWVWMFWRLAKSGKGWRRVNVSTERVFEC